jgi:hypothetical protein
MRPDVEAEREEREPICLHAHVVRKSSHEKGVWRCIGVQISEEAEEMISKILEWRSNQKTVISAFVGVLCVHRKIIVVSLRLGSALHGSPDEFQYERLRFNID